VIKLVIHRSENTVFTNVKTKIFEHIELPAKLLDFSDEVIKATHQSISVMQERKEGRKEESQND